MIRFIFKYFYDKKNYFMYVNKKNMDEGRFQIRFKFSTRPLQAGPVTLAFKKDRVNSGNDKNKNKPIKK